MSDLSKINLDLFRIVEILERSENNIELSIYTCELCSKHSSTISIFDTCNHHCCLTCLDNLYDSYYSKNSENNSVMFICPFCNSKVYDIIYKK